MRILKQQNNTNYAHSASKSKSRDWDDCASINSHMIQSTKKYKSNKKVPKIDLSRVEVEESDEEEDIDKMIEEAIEVELEQNPDIANQFESMEDFKRYIFDKYFHEYNQNSQSHHSQYSQDNSLEKSDKIDHVKMYSHDQYSDHTQKGNLLDMNLNVTLEQSNKISQHHTESNSNNKENASNMGLVNKYKDNKPKLGLNLKSMPENDDYQDEFMANYDNFSQSWRDQIDQNKKF